MDLSQVSGKSSQDVSIGNKSNESDISSLQLPRNKIEFDSACALFLTLNIFKQIIIGMKKLHMVYIKLNLHLSVIFQIINNLYMPPPETKNDFDLNIA